jgi:short-subunit dehydrogenase
MVERGQGAVINTASVAAFQPIPAQTVYAATKAFVRSFTEGISAELKGTGVTATALCPGPVATEFVDVGGFKKGEDDMPSYVSWSTPEQVAKAAIEAADKGDRIVIPGITNRFMASLGQHAPRGLVLGPMANAYRKAIGE